ncbi:MAG: dihydroorotate dehydrogenase electron transfer subunit [Clostridia bacterium]|nr:dihydroorotate dehydrogenase electron transfer subunit [Clostridia bacterium]
MKQEIFKIQSQEKIANGVYLMKLEGNTDAITASGQFVNIKLNGFFLRRPISVCDYDKNSLTLIYKTVGEGTKEMSKYENGTELDILVGLGNGYDTSRSGDKPLLIGGGVGVPPLYNLCKKLIGEGKTPTVILGFNKKEDVFFEEEFKKLGAKVYVTTASGEYGIKGFVTDAMNDLSYTYFYSCGPEPMLKAIYDKSTTEGELSFEERMGCGFGACMGCSCKTKYGNKRICKDGPVLRKEEVIW